ncbi:MAG: hypothetical protein RIS83_1911 [Pseudomonadota bacterium]
MRRRRLIAAAPALRGACALGHAAPWRAAQESRRINPRSGL